MVPISKDSEFKEIKANNCLTSLILGVTGEYLNEDLIAIRIPPPQEKELLLGFL